MVRRKTRLPKSGGKPRTGRLDVIKKKKDRNVYLEYEDFVQKQIELNPEKDLNRDWDGWSRLFLASKMKKRRS
jgi:hypothetical protein